MSNVKVEKSEVYDPIADKVGAFVDQSCNGKSAHSRNISEGYSRQLTATVVECVYETLKNLELECSIYESSVDNGDAQQIIDELNQKISETERKMDKLKARIHADIQKCMEID